MKVFKMDLRIPKARADGRPGFVYVKRGETPEEHGFTPEEYDPGYAEGLFPLLMDGEGNRVAETKTTDEVGEYAPDQDLLKVAIEHLLSADPEKKKKKLWTTGLKPRVEAIEKILETELNIVNPDITEAQRDEAWANFEKEGDNK